MKSNLDNSLHLVTQINPNDFKTASFTAVLEMEDHRGITSGRGPFFFKL